MSVVSWCILCVIWQSPEGYQKHLPAFVKPDTGRVRTNPAGINSPSVAGGFWSREAEQQVTIVFVLFLAQLDFPR
ncbi:hypothetical protein [Citrobacter freundii]|uniref:hypothetical protein n=1 Tax=Citrobacter freundii TaxID=546 RepID=UPI003338A9F0